MADWKRTCWINWRINWLARQLRVVQVLQPLLPESRFRQRNLLRGNLLRSNRLQENLLQGSRRGHRFQSPQFRRRVHDFRKTAEVFLPPCPRAWPIKQRQALKRSRTNQPTKTRMPCEQKRKAWKRF